MPQHVYRLLAYSVWKKEIVEKHTFAYLTHTFVYASVKCVSCHYIIITDTSIGVSTSIILIFMYTHISLYNTNQMLDIAALY